MSVTSTSAVGSTERRSARGADFHSPFRNIDLDRWRAENAALAYLKARADEVALQYKRIFNTLCRSHDQLVGISAALSASGEYGGEIRMSTLPITAPRFNLRSTADPNEYLPTMTHHASDMMVEDATASWLQARNRLATDVAAEIDDLIGPEIEKGIVK